MENGTHLQLLAQKESLYSKLWNSQQSKCVCCKGRIEDEKDEKDSIPQRSVDLQPSSGCGSGCC